MIDMLSIDEAIAHAREVAETCECEASKYDMCDSYEREVAYKEGKCAEEHEQLAEWLEELKAIKDGSIPIIHGKAELELHDKAIRNEAIDDFIHECDKYCGFYSGKNKSITREDILKIAEQLKAKNNERRSDGE